MVLSLLDHVRRGYRPKNSLIAKAQYGGWHNTPVSGADQYEPGLMVYRFSHGIYYANTEQFSEQVLELVNGADPDLGWFCLDAAGIDDVLGDVANAWKTGNTTEPRISFDNVEELWKVISPKKINILKAMTSVGQLGVRELSRKVGRDVSAVHRDLQALIVAGIVDWTDDGKAEFPCDEIHVDFTLRGVA